MTTKIRHTDEKDLDPVVTPAVSLLAESLALRSQLITGRSIVDEDETLANICDADVAFDFVRHDLNPEDIRRGRQIPGTELYESVFLDGE